MTSTTRLLIAYHNFCCATCDKLCKFSQVIINFPKLWLVRWHRGEVFPNMIFFVLLVTFSTFRNTFFFLKNFLFSCVFLSLSFYPFFFFFFFLFFFCVHNSSFPSLLTDIHSVLGSSSEHFRFVFDLERVVGHMYTGRSPSQPWFHSKTARPQDTAIHTKYFPNMVAERQCWVLVFFWSCRVRV